VSQNLEQQETHFNFTETVYI